ncbi:P-loop containing nucleoside triphosphate hydrolase [Pseudocohnilembus persalinus]|uniref:p-loop containing nucleoside triphosphate hydrolase n=1 Tax=Pseudocohnilembus persalinus TaxID=266149 RepID=A0A0V0R5C7_PSEPJ|nr:P-loop containing nucleoside triphosphate hydrolase [Pseudocohnilembus persalinus]|eukprot:KRX09676.1 P-loop containing nucleoside triphosphate hydrolase [Pseudocohnilembus persalinus]
MNNQNMQLSQKKNPKNSLNFSKNYAKTFQEQLIQEQIQQQKKQKSLKHQDQLFLNNDKENKKPFMHANEQQCNFIANSDNLIKSNFYQQNGNINNKKQKEFPKNQQLNNQQQQIQQNTKLVKIELLGNDDNNSKDNNYSNLYNNDINIYNNNINNNNNDHNVQQIDMISPQNNNNINRGSNMKQSNNFTFQNQNQKSQNFEELQNFSAVQFNQVQQQLEFNMENQQCSQIYQNIDYYQKQNLNQNQNKNQLDINQNSLGNQFENQKAKENNEQLAFNYIEDQIQLQEQFQNLQYLNEINQGNKFQDFFLEQQQENQQFQQQFSQELQQKLIEQVQHQYQNLSQKQNQIQNFNQHQSQISSSRSKNNVNVMNSGLNQNQINQQNQKKQNYTSNQLQETYQQIKRQKQLRSNSSLYKKQLRPFQTPSLSVSGYNTAFNSTKSRSPNNKIYSSLSQINGRLYQANKTQNYYNCGQNQKEIVSNIKSYARFRPLNEVEKQIMDECSNNNNNQWYFSHIGQSSIKIEQQDKQETLFNLTSIFDETTSQQKLYDEIACQTLKEVLSGFNGTIFAYGPTGSGKTYTMFGDLNNKEKMGIIPRLAEDIFVHVQKQELQQGVDFKVQVSMLEIYKENLQDLLNMRSKDLKIKESPINGIYIKGLSQLKITNKDELLSYISQGYATKKTRETRFNEYSSRSHTIFQLEVRQRCQKGIEKIGKLNLIDLAGCEKLKHNQSNDEETLSEAKKINLSLSCLGNVIHALANKSDHIPYRESKLTRILQESLGGNYKTSLIVTCSKNTNMISETLSSLKFASRTNLIKTQFKMNIYLSRQNLLGAYESVLNELMEKKQQLQKVQEILRSINLKDFQKQQQQLQLFSKENENSENQNVQINLSEANQKAVMMIENILQSFQNLKNDNTFSTESTDVLTSRQSLNKSVNQQQNQVTQSNQIWEISQSQSNSTNNQTVTQQTENQQKQIEQQQEMLQKNQQSELLIQNEPKSQNYDQNFQINNQDIANKLVQDLQLENQNLQSHIEEKNNLIKEQQQNIFEMKRSHIYKDKQIQTLQEKVKQLDLKYEKEISARDFNSFQSQIHKKQIEITRLSDQVLPLSYNSAIDQIKKQKKICQEIWNQCMDKMEIVDCIQFNIKQYLQYKQENQRLENEVQNIQTELNMEIQKSLQYKEISKNYSDKTKAFRPDSKLLDEWVKTPSGDKLRNHEVIFYEDIEPKYEISETSQGVKIVTEKSQFPSMMDLGLLCKVGSRNENQIYSGSLFLLQFLHLAYGEDPRTFIDNYIKTQFSGGQMSMTYDQENTYWKSSFLHEDFMPMLDLMLKTTLPEKKFVIQDSSFLEQNDPSLLPLDMLIYPAAYGETTLGMPIAGNNHQMTQDQFLEFQRKFITPKRLIVSAANVNSHEEFAHKVENKLKEFPEFLARKEYENEPAKYQGGELRVENGEETFNVAIVFESVNWTSEDMTAFQVINTILGNSSSFSVGGPGKGMHSRTSQNLLNKVFYIESASSVIEQFTDSGLFGIKLSGDPQYKDDLIKVGINELKKLTEPIHDVELQRGQNMLYSLINLSLERQADRLEELTKNIFSFGRIKIMEYESDIYKVTSEQINNLVKKLMKTKPTVVMTGQGANSAMSYEQICKLLKQ